MRTLKRFYSKSPSKIIILSYHFQLLSGTYIMYYLLVRTRRRQKTYYYYTLCHRRRRLRARYVYDGVLTKRNVAIDVKTGPHSCACRASTPLLSRTAIVAAAAAAATAVCPTVRPSVRQSVHLTRWCARRRF